MAVGGPAYFAAHYKIRNRLAWTPFLLAMVALFFLANFAKAQAATVVTTQPVDISPLLQAIVAAAAAVITVLASLSTAWLNKHLKLSQNSLMYNRVAAGVNSLAQIALAELRSVEAHNLTIEVKNTAVAHALSHATASFTTIAASLGLSDTTITTWVTGALESLLSPPPVVNITGTPTISPPAA